MRVQFILFVLIVLLSCATYVFAEEGHDEHKRLEQVKEKALIDNETIKSRKVETIRDMYTDYKQTGFPKIKDISVAHLQKLKSEKLLFVDIRDKKEQDVSMLPGAITQEEFERTTEKYKNKKIILYCTIGNRSGRYAKKLREQGIESYNLIGGILAWAWAEQPLLNEHGSTKKVHVYGAKWNILPENYQGIW